MRTPLHWITDLPAGRLAVSPRPRGGDWLEDEVGHWRSAGVNAVVSMLTEEEAAELDLADEARLCAAAGIDFLASPVIDRGVPESSAEFRNVARGVARRLAEGQCVAVHCRQGVGRAALLAAAVLACGGADPEAAFDRIAAARGCPVPDTPEQRTWLVRFARELAANPQPA